MNKWLGKLNPLWRVLLTITLVAVSVSTLGAVKSSTALGTRTLPSTSVVAGQTFNVTVSFAAPVDAFNTIGLSDFAPSGWTVTQTASSSVPVPDQNNVVGNNIQYIWYGPYSQGASFTAVYQVTVPTTATPGSYSFTNGTIEYYVGSGTTSTVAAIGGSSTVTVATVDLTPPTVTSTTPTQNAIGVATTSTIAVTFSKAMNHTSAQNAFSISPAVTGTTTFSWSSNTMTATLGSAMAYSTTYTVTISTGAQDTNSPPVAMAAAYSFSFTTVKGLTSLTVSPATASVAKGLTQQFTATGTYSDNSTANITSSVTWASSNTSVASFSTTAAGLATGLAIGSTNITAALGSVTSPAVVLTVTAPVLVSIAVAPAAPSITKGLTQQFTATGTYSDNSTANLTTQVTWASSDTSKVTIGASTGLATAVAVTTSPVTITATLGTVTGTASMAVTLAMLVSITVTPTQPTISIGSTQQFTATGTYTDATTADLTGSVNWTSSDSTKATITAGGLATAVAAGTATITAISGAVSGSTVLTVVVGFTVVTNAATVTSTTTATLNGNLVNLGSNASAQVSFDWGLTTAYAGGNIPGVPASFTAPGTFTANLTGLTASTTYHFRAKAVAGANTVYGSDLTFTTPAVAVMVHAPVHVTPGTDFNVTIDISQVANFYGAQFDVLWDSTVLQYNSTTWGQIGTTNISTGGIAQSSAITGGRRYVISLSNLTSGISGAGTMTTISFHVIGSLGQGSAMNLANGVLSDFQAQAIPAAWVNSSILVYVLPGDANGDGAINVLDLTKIAREILGLDPITPGADANGDSQVNVLDLTKVARVILGVDPMPQ